MSTEEQIRQAEIQLEELRKKGAQERMNEFNQNTLKQKVEIESLKGKTIDNIVVKTHQCSFSESIYIMDITITINGVSYEFGGDPFYVQINR